MSFNGSGLFQINSSGQPVVADTLIQASVFNAFTADIATGLSTCITKDGQTTVTANIPFAGYRLTGIGNSAAVDDAARTSQVQNSYFTYLTSVAGADTITGSATPTPAAYVVGQEFSFIPAANNTGAATLNVSSLGAGAIQLNGAALAADTLVQDKPVKVIVTAVTPVFEIIGNTGIVAYIDPLTTRGDMVVRGASSTGRLAVGSANTVLKSDGTDPSWGKVAGANIAMGSDAQGDILYHNGTDYARLGAGTSGQFLKTQGAGANPAWAAVNFLGTESTTTGGTAITFGSIPSGTNIIRMSGVGISTSGTSDIVLTIGDSGGLETASYTGVCMTLTGTTRDNFSAAYILHNSVSASANNDFCLVLTRVSGNKWNIDGRIGFTGSFGAGSYCSFTGSKTLSAELTQLSLTTAGGSDTFDANGGVNIQYQ